MVTSSRDQSAGVGKLLCESQKVAGISFTGSTRVIGRLNKAKLLNVKLLDKFKMIKLDSEKIGKDRKKIKYIFFFTHFPFSFGNPELFLYIFLICLFTNKLLKNLGW